MHRSNVSPQKETPPLNEIPGYGRARLWLGISGVGCIVTLSATALFFNLPEQFFSGPTAALSTQIKGILLFILMYTVCQLPFDFFGGYLLPRQYQRQHPSLNKFLAVLLRGISVHSMLLAIIGIALLLAARTAGVVGVVGVGTLLVVTLLRGAITLAAAIAHLELTPSTPELHDDPALPVLSAYMGESDDEGFAGSIVGLFQPKIVLLPMRWREVLDSEAFRVAVQRRQMAITTGSWRRGRLLSLAFTLAGIIVAATIVGSSQLASAQGIVNFSLIFTLWSFLGLLTLPTPSRRGVAEVDHALLAHGGDRTVLERTITHLDNFQDRERERPPLIETVFHPVPSVQARLHGPHATGIRGAWNAARTTVAISPAGLGLLGRAVHCNCGRPALWVFLPID
jgi:hypothetical protein